MVCISNLVIWILKWKDKDVSARFSTKKRGNCYSVTCLHWRLLMWEYWAVQHYQGVFTGSIIDEVYICSYLVPFLALITVCKRAVISDSVCLLKVKIAVFCCRLLCSLVDKFLWKVGTSLSNHAMSHSKNVSLYSLLSEPEISCLWKLVSVFSLSWSVSMC